MLNKYMMAISFALLLSQERWKIRVFRFSMAVILSAWTSESRAQRTLFWNRKTGFTVCPRRSTPHSSCLSPEHPLLQCFLSRNSKPQAKLECQHRPRDLQILGISPPAGLLNTEVYRMKWWRRQSEPSFRLPVFLWEAQGSGEWLFFTLTFN